MKKTKEQLVRELLDMLICSYASTSRLREQLEPSLAKKLSFNDLNQLHACVFTRRAPIRVPAEERDDLGWK